MGDVEDAAVGVGMTPPASAPEGRESEERTSFPAHTEILLRKANSSKHGLKEKFVAVYEGIFRFWDDLFLLKVNMPFLERCILLTTEEQLIALAPTLNKVFAAALVAMRDENKIRRVHSLETLAVMFKGLFRKSFHSFTMNVMPVICGVDRANEYFLTLLDCLNEILESDDVSLSAKELCVQLLVVIATACDNVNSNVLLEFMMRSSVFSSICSMLELAEVHERAHVSLDLIYLLAMLTNFRKYEAKNMYQEHLETLSSESTIGVLARSMRVHLRALHNSAPKPAEQAQGVMRALSGIRSIFSIIVPTAAPADESSGEASEVCSSATARATVLSLYILVHHSDAVATQIVAEGGISLFLKAIAELFSDVADVRSAQFSKMSLIVLLSLTDRASLNAALHAHSEVVAEGDVASPPQGASQAENGLTLMVDAVVSFVKHNLKKPLQVDLYRKALSIVRRVICYQKQQNVRFDYNWKKLWDALFLTIKFLSAPDMLSQPAIAQLSCDVATIFNLFITYGDAFLPNSEDYDLLYYEMIRVSQSLLSFYQNAEQFDTSRTVIQHMDNIKTIIRHFSAKLEDWQLHNASSVLNQEQILHIIRHNYESLKLKLLDYLDHVEPYAENPTEREFFRDFLRCLVVDYKGSIEIKPVAFSVI